MFKQSKPNRKFWKKYVFYFIYNWFHSCYITKRKFNYINLLLFFIYTFRFITDVSDKGFWKIVNRLSQKSRMETVRFRVPTWNMFWNCPYNMLKTMLSGCVCKKGFVRKDDYDSECILPKDCNWFAYGIWYPFATFVFNIVW